jgi:hypothetical protein
MIALIITIIKCNKNSLDRRSGAYRSNRKTHVDTNMATARITHLSNLSMTIKPL